MVSHADRQQAELEETVLTVMIQSPDYIPLATAAITAGTFCLEMHRQIFGAIVTLHSTGQPITLPELAKLLPKAATVAVTGMAMADELSAEGIKPAIKKLLQAATFREISRVSMEIQAAIQRQDFVDALVAELNTLQNQVPDALTIYGVDRLTEAGNIIIYFDKKSADLSNEILSDHVAIACSPKIKQINKISWSVLSNRKIVIWRGEHVEPADHLYHLLTKAGAAAVRIVRNPSEREKSWGIIEAVEQAGWNAERIMAYIRANLFDPRTEAEQSAAMSEPPPTEREDISVPASVTNEPFLCLGFDHGTFYYLPQGFQQVLPLRASEHAESNLNLLAQLNWYETQNFSGSSKGKVDWNAVRNYLFENQKKKGVYDTSKIRGRGAWEDDGRSVLHMGDKLIVNGKPGPVTAIKTDYIYESSVRLDYYPGEEVMENKDSRKLVELCNMLAWEKPIYGQMLAGWCVIAPICGALNWRPHIWLTGPASSGKSWIIDNIVRPMVGPIGLYVKGVTTEAGIRQRLGNDARPVIHDEAEGEDQRAHQRMQSELELARQASSDTQGEILKGTVSGKALEFKIRSCFAFSSIGTSAVQRADTSRISVLSLTKPGDPDRFKEIIEYWKTVINPEYCEKARSRSIKMIGTIRANATMFTQAIAERLGSQRTGDQVGTIIAGTHAFHALKKLNIDEAREWVDRQNWDEHATSVDQLDENRCLTRIMQTVIRVQGERNTYDLSIGELLHISGSTMTEHPGVTADTATAALLRHGIKYVYDGGSDVMRIAVSNTHHSIAKALEKTPWSSDWAQFLARIPGARKTDKTLYFGPGSNARAISLPLEVLGEG